MVIGLEGFNEHVIDVDIHGFADLLIKHFVNKALISGSCICFEPLTK